VRSGGPIYPTASLILTMIPVVFAKAAMHTESNTSSSNAILSEAQASHFANLALNCIQREYPNKPDHVANDPADVRSPRAMHPAFYGCFDWHSSVHGHWMLVRLLKLFPSLPETRVIRKAVNENLAEENLRVETAYLDQPNRESFERTYGWAWLLKLAEELHDWKDADGVQWYRNLDPLARGVATRLLEFLPKQTYPIRTGVHPNTAFALGFALDYARSAGNAPLEKLIMERSSTYFSSDRNYPAAWEPGGEDFFSPCLMEADLMRRIMDPARFAAWFRDFLPGIQLGEPRTLLAPAVVTDRSDPKLVHLDGLNLSRAWCMRCIAAALPAWDPARAILLRASHLHRTEALSHPASGEYAGEHWLGSFAVYLLSAGEH